MRVSDATLAAILKKAGKLTDENLAGLDAEAKKTGKPLQDLVVKHDLVKDEEMTQLYAKEIGMPFVKLEPKNISRKTIMLLPRKMVATLVATAATKAEWEFTKFCPSAKLFSN